MFFATVCPAPAFASGGAARHAEFGSPELEHPARPIETTATIAAASRARTRIWSPPWRVRHPDTTVPHVGTWALIVVISGLPPGHLAVSRRAGSSRAGTTATRCTGSGWRSSSARAACCGPPPRRPVGLSNLVHRRVRPDNQAKSDRAMTIRCTSVDRTIPRPGSNQTRPQGAKRRSRRFHRGGAEDTTTMTRRRAATVGFAARRRQELPGAPLSGRARGKVAGRLGAHLVHGGLRPHWPCAPRSDLKPARNSSEESWGCSHAAK